MCFGVHWSTHRCVGDGGSDGRKVRAFPFLSCGVVDFKEGRRVAVGEDVQSGSQKHDLPG